MNTVNNPHGLSLVQEDDGDQALEPVKTVHMLSVEDILGASDTAERTVEIPGWRGSLRIRPLLFHEIQQINELSADRKSGQINQTKLNALFISRATVEPQISFTHAVQMVQTRSGRSIAQLVNAICDDGVVTEEALERAEADFRQ